MKLTTRILAAAIAVIVLGPAAVHAQVTPADYDRALGLRERWMYLTDNLADPATWVDNTHRFYYRKTVQGRVRVRHRRRADAAAAAGVRSRQARGGAVAATGEKYTGVSPAVQHFRFSSGERAIEVTFSERGGRAGCPTTSARSRQQARGGRGGQPRSFGTVRDMAVPADNRPKRSPDGRWEAFVRTTTSSCGPPAGQPAQGAQQRRLGRQRLRSRVHRLVAGLDEACGVSRPGPATAALCTTSSRRRRIRCSRSSSRSSTSSRATRSISISRACFTSSPRDRSSCRTTLPEPATRCRASPGGRTAAP